MIKLYNTLTRKKEIFKPQKDKRVGLYTCGPTVYWYAHIGNFRAYIFEDVLKRVLEYNSYQVKHVMNITDVGHLTSNADTGEDKMEKGAKRDKKTAWEIANFYTKAFLKDIRRLNIKKPDILVRATDTIKEQINLIKTLEKKGFTYKIKDGIYFDTSKLKTYGRLWPKKMKIEAGKRIKMVPGKKNPTDFSLWKLTPSGTKRQMEWPSPWGRGFPGWHTECVVMSIKNLGIPFDIHCGGIDHILIHHTNEIAQAEAIYNKTLSRYWLHNEFVFFGKGRMGKSEGNIIILEDLIKKGLNPLAYRYLCLTCHYRSRLKFSLKILAAAQNSLKNLYEKIQEIKEIKNKLENKDLLRRTLSRPSSRRQDKNLLRADEKNKKEKISKKSYQKKFLEFINDDLNTPKALALVWEMIKNKRLNIKNKEELILDFDKVLGLNLDKIKKLSIPQNIRELVRKREDYRKQKNWQEADKIRKKIEGMGYKIEDTQKGPKIKTR